MQYPPISTNTALKACKLVNYLRSLRVAQIQCFRVVQIFERKRARLLSRDTKRNYQQDMTLQVPVRNMYETQTIHVCSCGCPSTVFSVD